MESLTYRINIDYYNEGKTASGKKYKVPHNYTCFGFDVSIQLNGNLKGKIMHDSENNCDFILYDPKKAGMKVNDKGYLVLNLTDWK